MPIKDKKLSAVLETLKEEYLKALPRKIEKLKKLTDAGDWENLYEEYHKLKGTGKTYGFPEISTICEKLESLAQNKNTQKKTLFLDAIDLIEKLCHGYEEGKTYDVTSHPLGKTLFRSGKRK